MDSNARYLNRRKKRDLDGTELGTCLTIEDVKRHMDRKAKYTNLMYFHVSGVQ